MYFRRTTYAEAKAYRSKSIVDGLRATTSISRFFGFLPLLPAVNGCDGHEILCGDRAAGSRIALDSGPLFGVGRCVKMDLYGVVLFVFLPEL